jgi:hypothetical protein
MKHQLSRGLRAVPPSPATSLLQLEILNEDAQLSLALFKAPVVKRLLHGLTTKGRRYKNRLLLQSTVSWRMGRRTNSTMFPKGR